MNGGSFTAGRREMAAAPDKVDMSLDDIIRLNKKEKQMIRSQANVSRRPVKKRGRLMQSRSGAAAPRGGGAPLGGAAALRNRRIPFLAGRRQGQGVITGLAAKRPAVLLKRAGALNRSATGQKLRPRSMPFVQRSELQYRRPNRQPDQQNAPFQLRRRPPPLQQMQGEARQATFLFHRGLKKQRPRSMPFVQRSELQYRRPNQQPDQQSAPFQLRRRPPPLQQMQKEARQATFLFHRGLKVQAQVEKTSQNALPARTHQWRTSTDGSGILTVSIDNPTARTQPEPPSAWTLHPTPVSSAPVKVEAEEKKVPKGVALQFDINSVGKPQTSMTLNERFRILTDRREAAAGSARGSRFVTVG